MIAYGLSRKERPLAMALFVRGMDAGERPSREQMQKSQDELLGQLKGVLTAEQLQKVKQMQEDRMKHMMHRPPGQ